MRDRLWVCVCVANIFILHLTYQYCSFQSDDLNGFWNEKFKTRLYVVQRSVLVLAGCILVTSAVIWVGSFLGQKNHYISPFFSIHICPLQAEDRLALGFWSRFLNDPHFQNTPHLSKWALPLLVCCLKSVLYPLQKIFLLSLLPYWSMSYRATEATLFICSISQPIYIAYIFYIWETALYRFCETLVSHFKVFTLKESLALLM